MRFGKTVQPIPMIMAAVLCVSICGCGSLTTKYGKSKGSEGRSSLNGFGALRNAYEQSGFRSRDVTRLTDRVKNADVIVWTPQVLRSVDPRVTNWIERWLSTGDKTLVYIVPDSGSEADYWIEAGKIAPPDQRLEYRKRAARSVNERMLWRMNRSRVGSNGWFRVEPLIHRMPVSQTKGPWRKSVAVDAQDADALSAEFLLKPFDAEEEKTAIAAAAAPATGQTGPAPMGWSAAQTTSPTSTPVKFRSLLANQASDTIVAEVYSERWDHSRIIVVAGGSLLTNFAFSRPLNRRLAGQIIDSSTSPKQDTPLAGFLTSNWAPISVSETKPGVPTATGMELLTVWPLSLVTMHGAILGLVVCLMLLPIFGRPKKIDRVEHSHFGDHLDAVAALMNRAGGEQYARFRISEYFKRVRGETSGPWVLPDPMVPQTQLNLLPSTPTKPPNLQSESSKTANDS